jgi:hypothetical protein
VLIMITLSERNQFIVTLLPSPLDTSAALHPHIFAAIEKLSLLRDLWWVH